ncbi:MAG: hypothetical protein V1859_02020 [archaeon]
MKDTILKHILDKKLACFGKNEAKIELDKSILKTKEAREIYDKTLRKIGFYFAFEDTFRIFSLFSLTNDSSKIIERHDFFNNAIKQKFSKSFLKKLTFPKQEWRPMYSVVIVTEDEKSFMELKKESVPVILLQSEFDLDGLDNYDLIQAVEIDKFYSAIESLPQAVFVSKEEAYLEKYLVALSGWKKNIAILKENINSFDPDSKIKLSEVLESLSPILALLEAGMAKKLSKEDVCIARDEINRKVAEKIRPMTIKGEFLYAMLSAKSMPGEIREIIMAEIVNSGIPRNIFTIGIPVAVDELALNALLKSQDSDSFSSFANKIKKNSTVIRSIPQMLSVLSSSLLYFDFISSVSNFSTENNLVLPHIDKGIKLINSKSLLINDPKPVSFFLDNSIKCSILTGANSGGKTTLLEHALQVIILGQMGFPVSGKVSVGLFSDIYYFAKTKGGASKGAFETLLTQMSKVKPGNNTLILADEIEAVTEPGVASMIIASTADYFIKKGCFLIIATHLGHEIVKYLPEHARVDGIEAKGLDDNDNLIIDHSPVLGRLANSTPELIIEKMARKNKEEFFLYLNEKVKNNIV